MWDFTKDTTVTTNHPTLRFAVEHMAAQLQARGLAARLWENHVVFGVAECWGRCREATIRPGDGVCVTSLAFDLYTDRTKTITVSDIIAGVGETARESVEEAVDNYITNVFAAFHQMHDPSAIRDDVPKMRLESFSPVTQRKTQWDIFMGGGLVTAGADTAELFLQEMTRQPPLALILDEVTGLLKADERIHWVKIFGSRQATGEVVNECALDNQLSPAANRLLAKFHWPRSAALQSFRQFYVLRPQPRPGDSSALPRTP